jgi:hypothetical protein
MITSTSAMVQPIIETRDMLSPQRLAVKQQEKT